MPKIQNIELRISHVLGKSVASGRIQDLLRGIRSQFGNTVSDIQGSWNDNKAIFSFKVAGLSVSGQLVVNCSEVKINYKSPFVFNRERNEMIKREIEKLLK